MTEKKKTQQKDETKSTAATVVYLGPEIPGVVSAGAVFKNGLTKKLEEKAEELPAIKMLLVPLKDAVKMKKELRKETSAARICYQKIAESAAQKGV